MLSSDPHSPLAPPTSLVRGAPPGRTLFSEEEIRQRVHELGRELSEFYQTPSSSLTVGHDDSGRLLVPCVIGLMNGALFFLTDLLREMELEVEIHCVRLASYSGTQSQGVITGLEGIEALAKDVVGRRVLVVDDILDTGRTLGACLDRLHQLGAAEVRTCVLLEKRRPRDVEIQAEWIGFSIADEFVVGYGLDFNGRHRGLQSIQVLT